MTYETPASPTSAIPTSTSPDPTIAAVSRLTEQVASNGIDADRVELLMLAHDARDLGVSPVLIDVMVDEHAPVAARLRAYGRVSSRTCALAPLGHRSMRQPVLVSA